MENQNSCRSIEVQPNKKGRPKRTWMEALRIDLKNCNLFEDLARDMSEWRAGIHATDPNIISFFFFFFLVKDINIVGTRI